jgi:aryl-alcohol dehydrogenase-like predicted oxidoreductase
MPMMPSRRDFLASASLAAAALALAPLAACTRGSTQAAAAGTGGAAPAAGPMLTRAIPSTGEALPVVGIGTSGSYEIAPDTPEFDALREVARIFVEGGGRVVDTAPTYGNAEEAIGTLMAEGGWRDRAFLATKLAADTREEMEAQFAESLRRLGTDRIDLLAVHNMRALDIALPYARELKEQGKVRYVGFTHFRTPAHAQLEEAMLREKPDFIQVNYSVRNRNAAERLLPAARDAGVAVMANRTFEDGSLFQRTTNLALPGWAADVGVTSWAQMFLKFALSHPAVTVVIPATGKPERQADHLLAGRGPMLDQVQQDEIAKLFA